MAGKDYPTLERALQTQSSIDGGFRGVLDTKICHNFPLRSEASWTKTLLPQRHRVHRGEIPVFSVFSVSPRSSAQALWLIEVGENPKTVNFLANCENWSILNVKHHAG